MDMIGLMPFYREERNSYPLSKELREDKNYLRNMIEKDIKSVDRACWNISFLISTQGSVK